MAPDRSDRALGRITVFVVMGLLEDAPRRTRYSLDAWRQFIILGIAQGAILALIALGYTLVYGILRMINFAHGEVFMFGAFGSLLLRRRLHGERLPERQPDRRDRHPVPHRAIFTSW